MSRPGQVAGRRLKDLPLWTPNFDTERLRQKQSDPESAATFDQGFRMNVIRPGDLMFPSFETCYQDGLALPDLVRRRYPVAIGVDLSGPKRKGTAIVAVGVEQQSRRRVPLEVRHGAWRAPETVRQLDEVVHNHDVQFIMVENNGYQQSLIEWIQELKSDYPWWMKIEAFTTGNNKADPQFGLPSFEVEFHNKGWVLAAAQWLGHPSGCECSWCLLKNEFAKYPLHPTADVVMATWFAKSAIDRWMWAAPSSMDPGNFSVR